MSEVAKCPILYLEMPPPKGLDAQLGDAKTHPILF